MRKQLVTWITAGAIMTLSAGIPTLAETAHNKITFTDVSETYDGSVDTTDPVGVEIAATPSAGAQDDMTVNVTGDVKVDNSIAEGSVAGVEVRNERSADAYSENVVRVHIGQEGDDDDYTGGKITVNSTGNAECTDGLKVDHEGAGTVIVKTGEINVTATGGYGTTGASVNSSKSETELTIHDGISASNDNADTTGLSIRDIGLEEYDPYSTVAVEGNVNASSKDGNATGVSLNTENSDASGERTEAFIYGNVTADTTNGVATGLEQDVRDGAAHTYVLGNIEAKTKTEGTATGVDLRAGNGSASAIVGGRSYRRGR